MYLKCDKSIVNETGKTRNCYYLGCPNSDSIWIYLYQATCILPDFKNLRTIFQGVIWSLYWLRFNQ